MTGDAEDIRPQMKDIDYHAFPDEHGRFGTYGGTFVAETLIAPLEELTAAYLRLRDDPGFQRNSPTT